MKSLVSIEDVKIFFDGTVTRPQLKHPEGVVVDPEGNVWCGGDSGEIYRISADGSTLEQVTTTDGFILGLTLDSKGFLYICDMKFAKVFRLDTSTGELIDFAKCTGSLKMQSPNFSVVDEKRNVLYVSDSNELEHNLPGIYRFDLSTGEGDVWLEHVFNFPNGLALNKRGNTMYVAETFGHRVSKVQIDENGNPGQIETFVELDGIPDGLVIDEENQLMYIFCYEPSIIYRVGLYDPQNTIQVVAHDPYATKLCHPTNGYLKDSTLYVANLGRWHISTIDV